MKNLILSSALLLSFVLSSNVKAQATDPFLGQIAFVPYTFTPKFWHECDGSLLLISQNPALFSLIGTTYGGNGTINFALPDMRGRVVVSNGTSAQGTPYIMGQTGGTESVTLTQAQMPAHNHTVNASTAEGDQNLPTGSVPADTKLLDKEYTNTAPNTTMNPAMVGSAGGNQPHENRPPFLTLKCIISMQGVFPTQN
jgi:microcystin-dependent protein